MKRLVQTLVAAIWIVGAVAGDLDVRSSEPVPEEPSMQLVIDTDHARLGVDRTGPSPGGIVQIRTRVVLAVETPWHSEWRVAVPMPKMFVPSRSEEPPCSPSEPEAQPSVITFVIRSLLPLP